METPPTFLNKPHPFNVTTTIDLLPFCPLSVQLGLVNDGYRAFNIVAFIG